MTIDWNVIQQRHDELAQALIDPKLDNTKRHQFQKEFSALAELVTKRNEIAALEKTLADAKIQAQDTSDPELSLLFIEEVESLTQQLDQEQRALEDLLIEKDERDDRSVYLEIRAGTGGQEAALFAGDLLRMYSNYALKKGWKISIESESDTDLGGIREVVAHIQGKQVFGHLKWESGVHRVQRVPTTETSGRIHTSTATVAVLPEAEEVEVSINPADLRIDVYRSSGAGGQHVNTTDSAVRITHIPTGVVVACQDERSQHKNKAKAMKILQSRILAAQRAQQEAEESRQRKAQVGTGDRAEKVRTYNFPQNRVTDHQVNVTLQKLDMVMAGQMDEIIEALQDKDKQDRREKSLSRFA